MSLDVYLTTPGLKRVKTGTGIFIREEGATREITRQEWDSKFPGREPIIAVSDDETETVYSSNITHNLSAMAEEAGIYKHCWRPEEIGITKAGQLIEPLESAVALMKSDPPRFKRHNAKNGWGSYDNFVPWVEAYLAACKAYPDAEVSVSR